MSTANPILLSKEHDITAFASNDPGRYVLQSVHYDAKGQFVEATNGRQLIRVPVQASEEFPPITGANGSPAPDCIIPIAPLRKAIASIPKCNLPILGHVAVTAVENEPSKIRLTTNDLDTENSAVVRTIEANYPRTDQVIPDKAPEFAIALSALELQKIVAYAAKHGSGECAIRFEFNSDLDPVRWSVTTQETRKVSGVLMPMRLT